MKTTVTIGALIMIVTLLAFGQTEKTSSDAEEVRRMNAEEVAALLKRDEKALGQMWSDEFMVTNPFNKFINKQQVLGMMKVDMLAFSSYDRNLEYIHVYLGSVVVAGSEKVVWAGKMPMAGQTNDLRFTAVWMKQGGRWQQMIRHASIISQH